MKTFTLTLTSLLLTQTLTAQVVAVIDAAQIQQKAMHHLEDTLKTTQIIYNQGEQINLLKSQLTELETLIRVTGDPAKVNQLAGIDVALASATGSSGSPSGATITVNGNATFAYDGGGMFSAVGGSFRMFTGRDVQRNEPSYRSFAAVDNTAANYDAAHEAAIARISALQQATGQTYQQLQTAADDATVQKILGALIIEGAELQAAAHGATLAFQKAQLQDIANRNDQQRQAEARREEQVSEIDDTFTSWARSFQRSPANTRLNLKRK